MMSQQQWVQHSPAGTACGRTLSRRRNQLAALSVSGALAVVSATANAQTVHTFPGCGGTLQACIEAAADGDIIEIATSTPIDESPRLERSLTLRSATGVQGTLQGFNTILAFSAGDQPTRFVIEGIRIESGHITVGNGGSGDLVAVVRRNVVTGGNTSFAGIGFRTGTIGEARGISKLRIVDNVIHMPAAFSNQRNGISVSNSLSPRVIALISGNSINLEDSSQGDAIDLPNGSNVLEARVIGNRITGRDYGSGISLFQFADGGNLVARVINNLITEENGNAGRPAGISVSGSQGNLNFSLINNTVANNRNGISIGGRADLGATMSGLVVNNIIAHNENVGLSIDSEFESTVQNQFNLVFGNGNDFFVPGVGTIIADPLFADAGSQELQVGSPAIDGGDNVSFPNDIREDLEGKPRIANDVIDMGAFEAPCGNGRYPNARWRNLNTAPEFVQPAECG